MTGRERVRALVSGELPDRVPYLELVVDVPFIYRLLGREFPADQLVDLGQYPTTPLDLQLPVSRILHRDNVTYHLQPPIPAERAPGPNNSVFYQEGHVKTWEDLDRLEFPDLDSQALRRHAREFVAQVGDYAAVFGTRLGIPATYLAIGMERFFVMLKDDPKLVEEVFRRYAEWSARVVYFAHETGFDVFWTADDIAGKTGLMWSPALFRELFWPHVRKVMEAVREVGIPWFYHSDGDLTDVLPDLIRFGLTGLGPTEPACMDARELRETYPSLVLVGNVDVDLLARGSVTEVHETVRGLIRDLAPAGRYAVSSGNTVTSYCKLENVKTMCDTVQELGAYPIKV
jgi:uroporphyrinogen decarboxylase